MRKNRNNENRKKSEKEEITPKLKSDKKKAITKTKSKYVSNSDLYFKELVPLNGNFQSFLN